MDYSKFMVSIQQHWGPFNSELSENLTLQYVMDRWPEIDMQKVFNTFVIKHSNQYRVPPSPAVLEDIFPRGGADLQAAAELVWSQLRKVDNMHSIFLTDPVAQAAIEDLGGWDDFCLRRLKDPKWTRNDFITVYQNLVRTGIRPELKVLFSYGDSMNGGIINKHFLRIIGDQEEGKKLLEQILKNQPQINGPRTAKGEEPVSLENVLSDVMKQLPAALQ